MLQRRNVLPTLIVLGAVFVIASLFVVSCDEDPTEIDETTLRITKVSGDDQSERVEALLPEELVVRVTNIANNVRPGVTVTFSSTAPGSEALPEQAVTNSQGLASCLFRLGTAAGAQQIMAAVSTDSTLFIATAVEPSCTEESTESASAWPSEHIFIVTTSSNLITTGSSVVIDFDPGTDTWELVLESNLALTDIAFSPRGDLYVGTQSYIYKVDPTTKNLGQFTPLTEQGHLELEPNYGGILVGISENGRAFVVKCSPDISHLTSAAFITVRAENLAVNPITRDYYFISGASTTFELWQAEWDGRSDSNLGLEQLTYLTTLQNAVPKGMCCDSTGTLYVTMDGDGNFRRIFTVDGLGTVDNSFFDFYAEFGAIDAGRWGDIALLEDELYLIDKAGGRLVVISTDGTFDREVNSNDFFVPGTLLESYGIAVSP